MTETALTPETIDAQLAAAEAEHRRLADKAAAIREAGETTRVAVELATLHHAYATLPKAAREARNKAQAELDTLANAEVLDLDKLLAAFDRVQRLDAECGAVAGHVARLDHVDPQPPFPNGAQRLRPPQCQRLHAGAKFSEFVDRLVTSRANAAESKQAEHLRDELHATIEAAEHTARQQAAELADGQRLQVDTPETLAEKYRQAITDISDDQLDPEAIRAAGLNNARNAARQQALNQLLAHEAAN